MNHASPETRLTLKELLPLLLAVGLVFLGAAAPTAAAGKYVVVYEDSVEDPARKTEALGWALSSHLALVKEHTPGVKLPSPRLLQAELVESGRLSSELAGQAARVRELTAPPAEDEDPGPPPSLEAGEGFIASVQALIERGQELAVEAGL